MRQQAKRVLVTDDDPAICELMASTLRRRSLIVDLACDGQQALELLREGSYAVVLLDLLMPHVDGFAVLEALRSKKDAPVVLVITGADRSVLDRLDTRKIHGTIRKPFDPEEVADLVVTCAEIKGRAPFEAMAISAMIAGGPLLAWLNRLGG